MSVHRRTGGVVHGQLRLLGDPAAGVQFLQNLTSAFPALTETERKICPLLRLNLETPDIAKLLFVSERNVENHRRRPFPGSGWF